MLITPITTSSSINVNPALNLLESRACTPCAPSRLIHREPRAPPCLKLETENLKLILRNPTSPAPASRRLSCNDAASGRNPARPHAHPQRQCSHPPAGCHRIIQPSGSSDPRRRLGNDN